MESYPSIAQDGHDITDTMYQLFGGEQQRGLPVLQHVVDHAAPPTSPHMSQQPSSILQPMSWAATRVGGFTGPPVETGATLPYREPSAYRQACMPTASISRSITSGARQPQTQLQALTQAELGTAAPQLMFPAHTSSEAQQASMAHNQSSAMQFLPSPAVALAPSLPPKRLHTTSSGAAPPSTSAASNSKPALNPSSWGPVTSHAHMLMSTPSLTLTDGREAEAGMWTSASKAVPVTQLLDSLHSTTSTEALHVGLSTGDLLPSGIAACQQASAAAVAEKEQAAAAAAAAVHAAERQQQAKLRAPSNAAQTASVQQQDEANQAELHRQNTHSNQSSESHQERRLIQGSLGMSGSHDFHVASDQAILAKGSPDIGSSDSADMSSKGAKRSRGHSSEVQGSATDVDPSRRLKKRQDLARQPDCLTDSRKTTDAEKRRIRRRVTNRESAKRIRDKREEQTTLMSAQVTKLEAHREALMSHMHKAEECCAQLVEEVKALKDKWCATCVENVKLYKKIFELRKALNPDAASSYLASQINLTDDQPGPSRVLNSVWQPAAAQPASAANSPCRPAGAIKRELSLGRDAEAPEGSLAASEAQLVCSSEAQAASLQ